MRTSAAIRQTVTCVDRHADSCSASEGECQGLPICARGSRLLSSGEGITHEAHLLRRRVITLGVLALRRGADGHGAGAGGSGSSSPGCRAGTGGCAGPGRREAGAGGGGRAGGPPLPHQNLQILDRRHAAAAARFRSCRPLRQALGRHVQPLPRVMGAPGNPMNDFASDDKPPKKTARTMMLMVRDLNAKLGAELGKPAARSPRCSASPATAASRFRSSSWTSWPRPRRPRARRRPSRSTRLRRQFYGSQAYDFRRTRSSRPRSVRRGQPPDDALVFLNAKVELFPMGARSYQAMSVAYQRRRPRAHQEPAKSG